jgi:hypothetical protein
VKVESLIRTVNLLLFAGLFGVCSSGATVAQDSHGGARITIVSAPPPGMPGRGQSPNETVEIEGAGAGEFNPGNWEKGKLHLLPDVRRPMLGPKLAGVFRNIYAGYAVEEEWGWRLFYSGWDGVDDPHDPVYETSTSDFVDFDTSHIVIEPGEFVHTSNVVAGKLPAGGYFMLATAADEIPSPFRSTNKPVLFTSTNGNSWNGNAVPYDAKAADVIYINGYAKYARADLNGANVFLQDSGIDRFYFSDWTHPGAIFWADGPDGRHLEFGGTAFKSAHAANDVQVFNSGGRRWYLMGMYKKGDVGLTAADSNHLWYSLSIDPHAFSDEHLLLATFDPLDRFIFSLGFVRRGNRLLGVLYGAGDDPADDHNQIFAEWLQKRIELVARPVFDQGNGATYEAMGALGPDRQKFRLPGDMPFDGELRVFDDGSGG